MTEKQINEGFKEATDNVVGGFTKLTESFMSLEGAKKAAAWYIDTSEKFANQAIDLQERATGWAKETPLAALFEAQNSLARKLVERSASAARSLWRVETHPHHRAA